jgi:hypothetical protein
VHAGRLSLCLSLNTLSTPDQGIRHLQLQQICRPQAAGQAQAAELKNITRHATALCITASASPPPLHHRLLCHVRRWTVRLLLRRSTATHATLNCSLAYPTLFHNPVTLPLTLPPSSDASSPSRFVFESALARGGASPRGSTARSSSL